MGHDSWKGFVATYVVASPKFNDVFGRVCCYIPVLMNSFWSLALPTWLDCSPQVELTIIEFSRRH